MNRTYSISVITTASIYRFGVFDRRLNDASGTCREA